MVDKGRQDSGGGTGGNGGASSGRRRRGRRGRGDGSAPAKDPGGEPKNVEGRPSPQGSGGGKRPGERGHPAGRTPSSNSGRRGESGRKQSEPAPARQKDREPPEPPFVHVPQRYALALYETFAAARADKEALAEKAATVDQLNIVIRAEGSMDDPELLALGNVKVFAGVAWALIHERRRQDGWYDEPR